MLRTYGCIGSTSVLNASKRNVIKTKRSISLHHHGQWRRNASNTTKKTTSPSINPSKTATSSKPSSSLKSPSPKNDNNNNQQQKTVPALIIGTIAGICGSLAGMGGGFVMIPLMTASAAVTTTTTALSSTRNKLLSSLSSKLNLNLGLGLTQHTAHGTSLFAVAATGIAGGVSYATSSKHAVQIESAASIALAAMVTARWGALYSNQLSQRALKQTLGVFMVCVSPIVPLKAYYVSHGDNDDHGNGNGNGNGNDTDSTTSDIHSKNQNTHNNNNNNNNNTTRIKDAMISGCIGLGSGFMAGLLGVGGGAVVVPSLVLFTSMDHYTALGTSLTAMVLPAMVGTLTHYKKGNVNLRVAPALAVGSLMGAYGGGRLGVLLEEELLRFGFSGLLFGLGVKTLVKA